MSNELWLNLASKKTEMIIIGLFGFFGSIARYLFYIWFGSKSGNEFPWATLTVNLIGCFLIGVIGGLVEKQIPNHRLFYIAGSVGFLGAFTTFSAFGFETLNLFRNQESLLAVFNIGANLIFGLIAVWLGRTLIFLGF